MDIRIWILILISDISITGNDRTAVVLLISSTINIAISLMIDIDSIINLINLLRRS